LTVVALHVEVIGAGSPRVVCCHGFTQTGRSWAPVASLLAERHEVVTVDMPGHGDSGHADADLWAAAELVGSAGGPAAYIGYSMGGRVALHLALLRPDLVTSLVVVGATGGIDDDDERARRRSADESLATGIERDGVDAFLAGWLAQPLFASLPAAAAGVDDRRRNTAAGLAASLRHTGTGTQEPLWDRLARLETPVLVVAGARDEKFTALGGRLVSAIGAGARFAAIPDAGHAAHLEQPAAFAALVEHWLATREVRN
jgi:2-succinyl-6-hydroxy-2,4-cyclohexadiene-1-carboxylate synthase